MIMTKISNKIVFFGTESFSLHALEALFGADFDIVAVVTKPDSPSGRGHKIKPSPIKAFALTHNVQLLQPVKLTDIIDEIKSMGKVTGVLVSYGKIIPESIISLFSPGIINLHPSLLPKYRGPSPIESAIINGDTETGVTIMILTAKMDAGPIYAQEHYVLQGNETKPKLYERLAEIGSKLLVKTLPSIMDGSLRALSQDDSAATYCKLLSKQDSLVNPSQFSAEELERRVRAHLGFPKTKITLNSHETIVTKSHASPVKESGLDILCGDGKYLVIEQLIAPSGREMAAKDFVNGYSVG